jgi:hypothetical protein
MVVLVSLIATFLNSDFPIFLGKSTALGLPVHDRGGAFTKALPSRTHGAHWLVPSSGRAGSYPGRILHPRRIRRCAPCRMAPVRDRGRARLATTTDSSKTGPVRRLAPVRENPAKTSRKAGENPRKRREWRGQRRRVSCAGRRNRPERERLYPIGEKKIGAWSRHHCLLISRYSVRGLEG